MSIPVDVNELPAALAEFGGGYLLTTAEGRIKVVHARPVLEDGVLRVSAPGRGSVANATVNPKVTLLWPAVEPGGPSLLVDGTATMDGETVVVIPQSGVLHVQR